MKITTQRALLVTLFATKVCANSINLSQFQQISGFSTACTAAYESTISGCTTNDFVNGNPCSQACARGLQQKTVELNTACAGISTSPDTLIGLFFLDKGVQELCPKIASATTAVVAPTTNQAPSTTAQSSAAASMSASTAAGPSTASSSSSSASLDTSSTSGSVDSTPATTASSSTTASIQTSINLGFTSSVTAIATPSAFGGDIGNLNGPGSGASAIESSLTLLSLFCAGLVIGL